MLSAHVSHQYFGKLGNFSSGCCCCCCCWCFLSPPKKALTRPQCEGEERRGEERELRKGPSEFRRQTFHAIPELSTFQTETRVKISRVFVSLAYYCQSIARRQ